MKISMALAMISIAGLFFVQMFGGEGSDKDKQEKGKAANKTVTTASGLKYTDLVEGKGPIAKSGDMVEVHYTGWLQNGKEFDSSVKRNQPFSFKLGAGRVIKGWDVGVAGMKVGGKRKLIIPYPLAYGESGRGPIPPKAELTFDVELLGIK